MAKQKKLESFLDSDDNWRQECISEIQKIKEKVMAYEWMSPAQKAEICEGLRKSQNKFIIKQLF